MRVLAFDTETKGFDWWDPAQQAFLIQWADDDHPDGVAFEPSDRPELDRFTEALAYADVVCAHNLPFDVHQTRETLGLDLMTAPARSWALHDTDLLSRVAEAHERTHGLKDMATRLLGVDGHAPEEVLEARMKELKIAKSSPGAYYEVYRAFPEDMLKYAKLDAVWTRQAFIKMLAGLSGRPRDVYDLELAIQPTLIEAERRGVRIDQSAVRELQNEYAPAEENLRATLIEELGDVLEGEGSRDGMIEALLKQGVPLHRKTEKTGVLRTDKFALQEFEDDFPIIADLMEWRRMKRFLDTYLDPMARAKPDLHTNFAQCQAWTGRMSSRRPNLQNLPKRAGKEVRRPLVPRPGRVFLTADFEGIEARLLAYYLGDPGYRELVAERDPHAWMASILHGGDWTEYVKGSPKEDLRNAAKNTLFAITYGAGAPRVADMNKVSKDQAKAIISTIKGNLPGYYKLMRRIKRKIKTVGYVETVMGRRQWVDREKLYVGLNALIQGSAADIMKIAVRDAAKVLDPSTHIIMLVHDEIVAECDADKAESEYEKLAQAMLNAWDLDPALSVEGGIVTTNYADA